MIIQFQSVLFVLLLIFIFVSCGVKGPPLPPIAATPQKADLMRMQPPQPQTTPSPTSKPEAEGAQK